MSKLKIELEHDKILYFDSETTGRDPERHGMIQLGFIVEIKGDVVEEILFTMNPIGKEIDPEAMKIHGYSEEDLKKFTPSYLVYPKILKLLKKYVDPFNPKDKFILAGHNVSFDFGFLRAFFIDNRDNFLGSLINSGNILDSLRLIPGLQWVDKIPPLKNLKLETVCEYFDVDLDNAHDALEDILATRECLIKIKKLLG